MMKEKENLLAELKNRIDPNLGFVLISYSAMTANTEARFRDTVVSAGGEYFVIKKRLFAKAASEKGAKYDTETIKGHLGIVYASSKAGFVPTTKALCNFQKENADFIKVIGGHFEGSKCSGADIEAIAKLPSLEVMRSQFLGVFEAPMGSMLATVEAILTSLMHCIENKISKEK
ncbi:MAG: 50S ribosomal protein L10 [Chlamydiae bacterium RIFCSPHIGHO2_12_FULL_49_11]|nr:MAG: 50S ribosomal protein L10 [Chlamydiae bacterium RIFCSPHIGHO2_12_FULL_49_11]